MCLLFKVPESNSLKVCLGCCNSINTAYKFRNRCISGLITYKNYVSSLCEISNEKGEVQVQLKDFLKDSGTGISEMTHNFSISSEIDESIKELDVKNISNHTKVKCVNYDSQCGTSTLPSEVSSLCESSDNYDECVVDESLIKYEILTQENFGLEGEYLFIYFRY